MAPFQVQAFILESLTDEELDERIVEWQALGRCANYERDSAVNLAVLVAAAAAVEEQWKRTGGRRQRR